MLLEYTIDTFDINMLFNVVSEQSKKNFKIFIIFNVFDLGFNFITNGEISRMKNTGLPLVRFLKPVIF